MLDTDSISFALRAQGNVGSALQHHLPSQLCVSAVTVAELRYGADLRQSAKLHELIDRFLSNFEVVPFDEDCASLFGKIASDLNSRGLPIGKLDVMIAAQAMSVGATLVTNNVKHFERVRGLRVENWY